MKKKNNPITLQSLAIKHPYYCSDSNYYSNEASQVYETWKDFYEEFGQADKDYNLCFRWDIKKNDETDQNYYMEVFYMLQRKGNFIPVMIKKVEESDVPAILKFLQEYWNAVQKLWQPISEK